MKTRKLGNIEVSEIGIGCMGFSHGYGEIPSKEYSIEAIKKAYQAGCTFFDTAEAYGHGHNEKILAAALDGIRQDVVIATKFHFAGFVSTNEEEIENYIRQHLMKSLQRLKTDYIDLYYLHRFKREIPIEIVAKVMGKLIGEGVIKGWGLSQVGVDTIQKAHEVTPLSAVQNIYSMVERSCEKEVIPYCMEHHIALVPFSPIASGLLSGNVSDKTDFSHYDDVRKYVPQLLKENIDANQAIVELIKDYAHQKQATPAQISLAWMIKKYPNIVPIPGSKNIERILENLSASEVELTDVEFNSLDQALDLIPIKGFRGHIEFEGDSMKDWGRRE